MKPSPSDQLKQARYLQGIACLVRKAEIHDKLQREAVELLAKICPEVHKSAGDV